MHKQKTDIRRFEDKCWGLLSSHGCFELNVIYTKSTQKLWFALKQNSTSGLGQGLEGLSSKAPSLDLGQTSIPGVKYSGKGSNCGMFFLL